MIDPAKITFPITAQQMNTLQRKAIGRELCEEEREFFYEVAAMANQAYEAGRKGSKKPVRRLLAAINESAGDNKTTRHLATIARSWVSLAFQKGLERLHNRTVGPQIGGVTDGNTLS